jgi:hypothetical protein
VIGNERRALRKMPNAAASSNVGIGNDRLLFLGVLYSISGCSYDQTPWLLDQGVNMQTKALYSACILECIYIRPNVKPTRIK